MAVTRSLLLIKVVIMSGQPATRPKVPEGTTALLKTRQKKATETGYVGYDTIWESFQTEVEYTTPKAP